MTADARSGEPCNPSIERQLHELRDTGLLWLLNRVVFHPRGFALALFYEGTFPDLGACTGWGLVGDGTEPWTMGNPTDEQRALGAPTEDELFHRVEAFFDSHRPG